MHICYSASCYKTYQNVTCATSCSFALTCFIISVFQKIDNFMASLNLVLLCSALCHPNTLLREIWDHLFQTPTYVIKRTSFACFVSGTSTFRNLIFCSCYLITTFFSFLRSGVRLVLCGGFSRKKKKLPTCWIISRNHFCSPTKWLPTKYLLTVAQPHLFFLVLEDWFR